MGKNHLKRVYTCLIYFENRASNPTVLMAKSNLLSSKTSVLRQAKHLRKDCNSYSDTVLLKDILEFSISKMHALWYIIK